MIHTLAFHANDAATATETALTAVNTDRLVGGQSPYVHQICGICADDLTNIYWTSPGLPVMGIRIAGSAETVQKVEGNIDPLSQLTVVGTQGSGGNLDIASCMVYSVGRRNPKPLNGKPASQLFATTAGTDAVGTFITGTNFNPNKKYYITGVRSIGTVGEFAVLRHPDFLGDLYVPAIGATGALTARINDKYEFPEKDLPMFNGSTPLQVASYGDGNAVGIYITMIEA